MSDSKLTKSLQNHNLQNLVFGKRVRQVVGLQPAIESDAKVLPKPTQTNHHQVKVSKPKKQESIKNGKQIKRGRPRKHPKEADSASKEPNKGVPPQKSSKKLKPKKGKKESGKMKGSEEKGNQDFNIQNNESSAHQQQPEQQQKQSQKQQQKVQEFKEKPQQNQIELLTKKLQVQAENHWAPQKEESKGDNSNQEVEEGEQEIDRSLLVHGQVQAQQDSPVAAGVSRRVRRAKLNALNKTSVMEDDSVSSSPSLKKRKMIHSHRRSKNHYTLNRVFRKHSKIDLPAMSIAVDLERFPLSILETQLGPFEIIHCSLPIPMLLQLSGINQLMVKGFIFIWAEKGEINLAHYLLKRWGYDLIDQIIWIKCDESTQTVFNHPQQLVPSSLFLNSHSSCIVGYKCPSGQKADYYTKNSNNLIFAEPNGNLKPALIYEMAELMMPGSKKLQIGGPPVKGWFTLKHESHSLHACHSCFRSSRDLYIDYASREVTCKLCYQGESQELLKMDSKVTPSSFGNQELVRCERCESTTAFHNEGLLVRNQCQQLCKDCFFAEEVASSVSAIRPMKYHFAAKAIECSNCSKSCLLNLYLECSSCRNHYLCADCFWVREAKQNKTHDWRLKKVVSSPETKAMCSTCRAEVLIPYWCCETCSNWVWCGNCEQKVDNVVEHHPHLESGHTMFLMV